MADRHGFWSWGWVLGSKNCCRSAVKVVILLLIIWGVRPAEAIVRQQKTTINRWRLPAEASVKVSAHIGGYLFNLEGLTSPWARVEFYSTEGNINLATIADQEGVFRFRSVLVPLQTGDFCFLAYDTNGVANNPLCFPPPIPRPGRTTIRGIILSPSFWLEKGLLKQGETITAQGKTFPGAKIKVFLFEEARPLWSKLLDLIWINRHQSPLQVLNFLKPSIVKAQEGALIIEANQQGQFSFKLPTQKSTRWRIFVAPQLTAETPIAKSNLLTFTVISWWRWWLIKLLILIKQILWLAQKWLFHWLGLVGFLITAIVTISKQLLKSGREK